MIIGEFCECYPPNVDGVGMVVRSYAEELNKTQEACYYIAPKSAGKQEPAPSEPFPVIQYASVPIPNEAYSVGMPAIDLTFQRDLKDIPFDIVHAHTPFVSALEATRIARERNIPLVATLHSKYYDDVLQKTHSEAIAKAVVWRIVSFFNRCDEVWTVNDSTAEVLRGYGYRGEIVVMPNGTDLWYPTEADALSAQERFGLGTGEVFLFVGQQNFKKNLDTVIEAAALYAKKHRDFRLVSVGQGPDSERLKEMVRSLGLDERVVFTGHITDRDVLKGLYARADLFVFPSLYDTAGLVVREAAAAGTPSLLIEGSCAAEGVTDGENGFLCRNTPEDVCACMERALPFAKEVGARARETIPKPWHEIAEAVADRYEALIERKKTQVRI
jgi:glycosyltransferase involved in cell wall biosynthesis